MRTAALPRPLALLAALVAITVGCQAPNPLYDSQGVTAPDDAAVARDVAAVAADAGPVAADAGAVAPHDAMLLAACVSGTLKCVGASPHRCNAHGEWEAQAACPFVCEGQGVCGGVCVPSSSRCDVGQHETCTAAARWAASPGDCTPPRVLATAPTSGATGVFKNAKIEIVFDEAMDEASVAAAYASAELPPSAVDLVWTGNTLAVRPKALDYAATPRPITVTIGTGAKDLAGNALAQAASLRFTLLKRTVVDLPIVENASGFACNANGDVHAIDPAQPSYRYIYVATDTVNGRLRYFCSGIGTFGLGVLPVGLTDEVWESATLFAFLVAKSTPAATQVERIRVPGTLALAFATRTALGTVGTLTMRPGSVGQLDVTAAVRDDYGAGTGRAQLRFIAPSPALSWFIAHASDTSGPAARIEVKYLSP